MPKYHFNNGQHAHFVPDSIVDFIEKKQRHIFKKILLIVLFTSFLLGNIFCYTMFFIAFRHIDISPATKQLLLDYCEMIK